MPEIIKPKLNNTALTKAQARKNLREHLLMLLEAMQYQGNITHLDNKQLRELVEKEKLVFLRKLQAANDQSFKA